MGKISIILSGGAAKGGVEVGMLKAIMEVYDYKDIELIVGTSVGSLNGALLAQKQLDKLINIWSGITSWKKIYSKWFFRYITGFFKGGLVSFRPMEKIINSNITNTLLESNIDYYACDVNLFNRKKTYTGNRNEKDISIIKKHILSSASMVPHFPPVKIGNDYFTDGGAREQIPVKFAVETAKETDVFFILLTKAQLRIRGRSEIGTTLTSVLERIFGCLSDEVWNNDIKIGTEKYWNNKDKFVIIEPETSHVTDFEDSINQINIQKDIEHGYDVAKKAIDNM